MSTQQIIESWESGVEPYNATTLPKITTGLIGCGFWARCGIHYEGGYRTERQAINAVKRKAKKYAAKFPTS